MTLEQLRQMEPRGRDALVAEKVMGWRRDEMPGGVGLLDYSTDPAADHEVLRHVRETWDESAQWRFIHTLASVLRIRDTEWTTSGTLHLELFGNGVAKGLRVGDYSLAALAAALAADAPRAPAR